MLYFIIFYRTVKGYTGIGSEYCDQFEEIQKSIVAEYGAEADIDWPIVHNAGLMSRFLFSFDIVLKIWGQE